MNIFVLIKQVPVISEIAINHQTFTADRSAAGSMMNPCDLFALEAAFELKTSNGGTVTVLTMGNESSESQLREAVGMGADRAVRITDDSFAGSDTLVTAKVLATAIQHLGGADCIFCGQASVDSATGQIGGKLSALLHMNLLTSANHIVSNERNLTIRRIAGTGYEVWSAPFPVVCSVSEGANHPRMATLRGKMAAKKAEIELLTNEDLKLSEEQLLSLSKVEALFPAARQEVGHRIIGADEKEMSRKLADILIAKHLI
ncbi:MAG: electron transfer flavoprotein beta subunit/FixA family protein [Clostridia bacterium]|nr:electron transfer flavoprotein subunit beta/FixA family protein [Lachnospiraceae bacterium]NCB99696.1 electron transfer flavoprotein beta subunit/FixA family protein [Clostridia bacterium]NCD01731.1 electron transfer flavoprotein beta subunit/FixA family protein [Clostridia bacterium]